MQTGPHEGSPRVSEEHRRWLIGIGISVAFGVFGAVMAVLSYTARATPPHSAAGRVIAAPSHDSDADGAKRRQRRARD